jgi:hypothetical protein
MIRVCLTQGFEARIDDRDHDMVSRYRWKVLKAGGGHLYAARTCGNKTLLMHRVILGARHGQLVDHIDHDGLNNCRANLRLATQQQNQAHRPTNSRLRKSSKFRGVSWNTVRRLWVASIGGVGVHEFLGRFDTEEEAALAYDRAALRLYGEFASLNTPDIRKLLLDQGMEK